MHDINQYVVKPATKARACSFVELVASEPQPPDFVVLHYLGQPLIELLASLKQHADDRLTKGEALGAYPHGPVT